MGVSEGGSRGRNICIHVTDSRCCAAETNTTLESNYACVCVCVCVCVCARSLQLCLNLCDPMDRSPPGSSVHGILQARILEWVAISFSRGSLGPRDRTHISYVSCTGRWVLYH